MSIPPLIGADLVIGWIALRTLRLALSGRLLPGPEQDPVTYPQMALFNLANAVTASSWVVDQGDELAFAIGYDHRRRRGSYPRAQH